MKVLAGTGEHLSILKAIRHEALEDGCAVSVIMHNGIMRLAHNE